jgi:hypothetical protein
VSVATGIVFGIAPALRATSLNVSAALKETSRSIAGSRSLLTRALLVLQVAVSLVLLIAAGLFLRTLNNLRHVDVGFNTQNLVVFRVNPALNRYDDKKANAVIEEIATRLKGVAGVRAVGVSSVPLLANNVSSTGIFRPGRTYAPRQSDDIYVLQVSPDYFKTMEIPLVAGRGFTDRDNQTAPKVVIINETAARKYFANENPIGLRFGTSLEKSSELEIVGVLRDSEPASSRAAIWRLWACCGTRSTRACGRMCRPRCSSPRSRAVPPRCFRCGRRAIRPRSSAPSAKRSGRSIRACR